MNYAEIYNEGLKYNLKTNKGKKAFARWLSANGISRNMSVELACEDLGLYWFEVSSAMCLAKSEDYFIKTYGECGREYVDTYDKCVDLGLSRHHFDAAFSRSHNEYVRSFPHPKCKEHPTLYSFTTFDSSSYNQKLVLKNRRTYSECFVRIDELGVGAVKLITTLLKEKIKEVIDYREKNKWQGELNLDEYARKLQTLHPNLTIKVREGKRACDGNCEPYKAIVVYEGSGQCGSITMEISDKGICRMSKRVPLCGESTFDTNNETFMADLEDCIEFMTH